MANTANLDAAMSSLLKIYYLRKDGKSDYYKDVLINIVHFMNHIFDRVEKRCLCSGNKIKIYHPYKIGTKENSIGDQYKITEAPSLIDRCDQYEINFDVDNDVAYLIDLFDEFKKKMGSTHFNIVEFQQTISVKKENRDTKGQGPSLNDKNDEEVLKDVVSFIDEQIFTTGMGGFLLSDKFYTGYEYRRFDRDEFLEKLKKYVEEHAISFGESEDKEEYIKAFNDAKKKAKNLINDAWRYIDNREKDDVVLKKIKKTLKSSRVDEHVLEVSMPFYTLHSKTVDEMIVSAKGAFGAKVLQQRSELKKKRKKYIVKQLSNDGWTCFRAVVRSFFVEYALMTNNFSNIGICGYEKCKELFVKKNQRKEFCNENCKNKTNKKNPRNKCRDNSNQWIVAKENKLIAGEQYFSRIEKNDCKNCKEIVKNNYKTLRRGHCPRSIVIIGEKKFIQAT